MSSKHKASRLIRLRRILAVLAVVLFGVTLFSGYMHFFRGRSDLPEPREPEPMATDFLPMEPVDRIPQEPTTPGTDPAQAETESPAEPSEEVTAPTTEVEFPNEFSSGSALPEDAGVDAGHNESSDHSKDPGHMDDTQPTDDAGHIGDTDAAEDPILDLAEPAGDFGPGPDGMEEPPLPQDHDPNAVAGEAVPPQAGPSFPVWGLVFWSALALLALDLVALLLVHAKIRKIAPAQGSLSPLPRTVLTSSLPGRHAFSVGTLHQPGRRQYQQDSLGHSIILGGKGILAVVADGMGGLKDGDKVSQQIVLRTLELGDKLQPDQTKDALYRILNQVNEEVNQVLTPEGLYKCGSTVIAVLVQDGRFQWIAVGDSRIYLYRAGYVNRINRDHDLLQEWMPEILSGQRTMEASLADPNARKLTSFIGMGRLRYVDGSVQPIDLLPGDRLVLMSDGVYGEVPEDQLAAILKQYPDVRQAAKALDQRVQANHNPHQDNYTALILGF